MNLTDQQYADAARELQRAGIYGSDLATSFAGACRLAGDVGYEEWLHTITSQSLEKLREAYGHDFIRAVYALRQAQLERTS